MSVQLQYFLQFSQIYEIENHSILFILIAKIMCNTQNVKCTHIRCSPTYVNTHTHTYTQER